MYTDVFGSNTLPPSEYGFNAITLTTDATLVWPYNTEDADYAIAKILQITCGAGNAVTLPDARQVSTGEDFLIRNVGANNLIVKDASGVQIASVAVGAASYFYLTNNTTLAGVFGVIGFGVGTSTVDAASLVGYGIKAVGASLNQSHPVLTTASGITIGTDHRSKLVVFTGGVATFNLTSAGTLGDDYFVLFRNDGTGTATIDPASAELLDGMSSIQVQPGESLILICTGTQWYSVGYGRSTLYQFTQLTKDVSAGGTITLSAAEAANKLITFIGNPSGAVNVVVPSVVAVYYTQSNVSTAQTVTLKTAAGSGVGITQGARIIALCDGTNVVSAQSAVANASVSLTDGSSTVPSLFFATQTNTGLYKSGTQDVGVTVAGGTSVVFGSTGPQASTIGANATQRHTVPAVASDTVTLNSATQPLTNKTVNLTNNTVTGTIAQFNTACSDADFATLAGTETLTNKTVNLTNNTVTGTIAQFNTACSDADFATLAGTETLTNKTVNLTNNTVTGTIAQFNTACSDADFATLAGTETLTNKTIVAANNIITTAASGNLAATNLNAALAELQDDIDTRATSSALSSHTGATSAHGVTGNIVGTTDTQPLTNKTMGSGSVWNGGTIGVQYGGTGVATLTGLVKGNGTSAFTAAVAGTDYTVPATTVPRDSSTGAASIPTGTTAERPGSPSQGMLRRNSQLGQWEGYNGSSWDVIPDTSGVVTLTGTQTLQNKTFDSTNTFNGNVSGASGQLAGFRNKIINGGCQVAQRGMVAITNNAALTYGGADRIAVAIGSFTTASGTLQQASSTLFASGYAQNLVLTSTGSGSVLFAERLELRDTTPLNGKAVTVSCKVWQNASSTLTPTVIIRKANSADNFSAVTHVAISSGISCPSSTLTTLTFTTTLGTTDASNGLEIGVNFSGVGAVTGASFYLGDFQLEAGSIATPFEHRPYGLELALCQRYYEKSYRQSLAPGATSGVTSADALCFGDFTSGGAVYLKATFCTEKRGTPSIRVWDAVGNLNKCSTLAGNNQAATAGVIVSAISTASFHTDFAIIGMTRLVALCWDAAAEL